MRKFEAITDEEFSKLETHLPEEKRRGRKRSVSLRNVLDALLYRKEYNCTWRDLPRELFPPWPTVYTYFKQLEGHELLSELHRVYKARKQSAKSDIEEKTT